MKQEGRVETPLQERSQPEQRSVTLNSGSAGEPLPEPGGPRVRRAREALHRARRIIIVTKFRFMGDTLVATPFFKQLRGYYPDAELTLLTSPSAAHALAHCPYLTHLKSLSMQGVSRWRHTKELWRVLRSGDYDAAFLLNRSLHCAYVCAASSIPMRIGYENEHRGPFLTLPIPYFFDRNEVDSHLDMLRALDLPVSEELPELWITSEEQARAREILAEQGWQPEDGLLIGLQPGANDPHIREWGAERYARIAERLASETGGRIVIMGGMDEAETASKTMQAMRFPPIDLVGKLKLREALAVVAECGLWLGNDTGLLHAAVALRVASVGLFGPNKIVRWGYDAPRHRSLTFFPDPPARDDAGVRRALDRIDEDDVWNAVWDVLDQPEEARHQETFDRPPYFAATRPSDALASAPRR